MKKTAYGQARASARASHASRLRASRYGAQDGAMCVKSACPPEPWRRRVSGSPRGEAPKMRIKD
jgi:hypothetical protein